MLETGQVETKSNQQREGLLVAIARGRISSSWKDEDQDLDNFLYTDDALGSKRPSNCIEKLSSMNGKD